MTRVNNWLTDDQLAEILSGVVDGVEPTTQELAMAVELQERRKADSAEPDYICYDCGCCGWKTIDDWRDNDACPKCNHRLMGKTELYTVPPVQETGVYKDMLNIVGLLENNEWAEHCTSTVLGSLLESEITRLVGKGQPAPVVPETLPCPVHLVPGLRLGKGCKTETLLIALQRRAEYYAELDAMTPEERAKHYANIEAFKAMLPQAAPVAPEDLRRSFEAVARLNNEMYRWTSRMSYNGSYVGEPEGLLKRNIREIEHILDGCKNDKGE
ncbi:hypothetical protein ACR8TE_004243 [Salmonella enterica]